MKFLRFLKRGGFIACVLVLAVVLDILLASSGWVQSSGFFWLDDFEMTRRDHPEEVWDKVIFGSSEIVSGFREDLTATDYVNLGMDYGVIKDLNAMLEGGHIKIGSELVLALNWCTFCDTLDTNPTYEWHRRWYEPYVYFQRDRLGEFVTDEWKALLGSGEWRQRTYLTQTKAFYYGMMTAGELSERMDKLHGLFWANGVTDYEENLAALDELFSYCEKHGIRVRAFWLPENQAVESDPTNDAVKELAREKCEENGVYFEDMTTLLPDDCFYDTGHMNYEHGAVVFTEVLDKWLAS